MCGGVHHGEVDELVKLEMIVRMYSKSFRDNYICVVLGVAYVHTYVCTYVQCNKLTAFRGCLIDSTK